MSHQSGGKGASRRQGMRVEREMRDRTGVGWDAPFLPEQHLWGLAFDSGKEGCPRPVPSQLLPSPPGDRVLSRASWSREESQSHVLVGGGL